MPLSSVCASVFDRHVFKIYWNPNTRTRKHTAARNAWRHTNAAGGRSEDDSGNKSARWKKVGEGVKERPGNSHFPLSSQHTLMQILILLPLFLVFPLPSISRPPTKISHFLFSFPFSILTRLCLLLALHVSFKCFVPNRSYICVLDEWEPSPVLAHHC